MKSTSECIAWAQDRAREYDRSNDEIAMLRAIEGHLQELSRLRAAINQPHEEPRHD